MNNENKIYDCAGAVCIIGGGSVGGRSKATVNSIPGQGVRVRVHIPIQPAPEAP